MQLDKQFEYDKNFGRIYEIIVGEKLASSFLTMDVHDKKQKPEIQIHLLQALPGKSRKAAVQHGDVIRKCFLKHGSWTFISFHIHSIILLLDFVK